MMSEELNELDATCLGVDATNTSETIIGGALASNDGPATVVANEKM
jgi:hypothetical protein